MRYYKIWARIGETQTVDTVVMASSDYFAKQIGESLFGVGNVLGYSAINEV